jgi:hypothetical protein
MKNELERCERRPLICWIYTQEFLIVAKFVIVDLQYLYSICGYVYELTLQISHAYIQLYISYRHQTGL